VLRRACDELARRIREEPELRPALLEQLRSADPIARFGAAHVFFHGERPSLRLLPALLASLELPDGDLRWQAAQMLAVLGRLQGEVLPVLVHEARHSESAMRRRMSLFALRELGPEREEVEGAMLGALSDADPDVQRAGLACLAKLSAPSVETLDRVHGIAREHADPKMRRIAVVILPPLLAAAPERRDAVERTVEALAREGDPSLRRAALAAAAQLRANG
jgi:HEAT repeat protein